MHYAFQLRTLFSRSCDSFDEPRLALTIVFLPNLFDDELFYFLLDVQFSGTHHVLFIYSFCLLLLSL